MLLLQYTSLDLSCGIQLILQWKTETLFSIQWCSLVALIAISYAIWWVIVDKRRLTQILLFGPLVAIQRM